MDYIFFFLLNFINSQNLKYRKNIYIFAKNNLNIITMDYNKKQMQPLIDKFLPIADKIAVGGKIAADGYAATDEKVYVADEITPDIWRVKDENGVIPNQIDCANMILKKINA